MDLTQFLLRYFNLVSLFQHSNIYDKHGEIDTSFLQVSPWGIDIQNSFACLEGARRRSMPNAGKVFCTLPHQSWVPPSLLCNGYSISFLGVKRPGLGVDHIPTSSAEVKERIDL